MNYRSQKHTQPFGYGGIHFTGGESAGAAKRTGELASKKAPQTSRFAGHKFHRKVNPPKPRSAKKGADQKKAH